MVQRFVPSPALLFCLGLGLLAGAPARGAAAGSEAEPFSESFDVRVINLEAVVEDGDGKRVYGLGSGDFEILVDGKSQPVDYFSEIRGSELAPPAAAGAAPAQQAPARPPGLEGDGRVPTSYVVFVDLSLSDRRRARLAGVQLADQLGRLPPGDRIALFVFDGRRLENLADWNDSRERALASLRDLRRHGSSSVGLAEIEASDQLRRRIDFEDDDDLLDASASTEDAARRLARRIEASFTALSTAMRTAEPPPGRRVVINFAGAWPRDLAAYFGIPQNAPDNLANRARAFYPTQAYSGVYETANLLGYTLYSADLYAGRPVAGSTEDGGVEDSRLNAERDFDRDFERDATLMRYAEQTGGRAFTAGWDAKTLDTVREDIASFYWLGFTARRLDKDKDHKLEVRVKRPGLKVRSRKQFSDLSRKTEIDQELESRLLFSRTRAKEDFTVVLGSPVGKRSEMNLPITFRIPLDQVVFLPAGKGFRADLELRVAALDQRGEQSRMPSIPIKLEGPQPQPGQYATYETALRLSREARRFVLGIYDKKADKLLVSTVDLERELP